MTHPEFSNSCRKASPVESSPYQLLSIQIPYDELQTQLEQGTEREAKPSSRSKCWKPSKLLSTPEFGMFDREATVYMIVVGSSCRLRQNLECSSEASVPSSSHPWPHPACSFEDGEPKVATNYLYQRGGRSKGKSVGYFAAEDASLASTVDSVQKQCKVGVSLSLSGRSTSDTFVPLHMYA